MLTTLVFTQPASADQGFCIEQYVDSESKSLVQLAAGMGTLPTGVTADQLCYDTYLREDALQHEDRYTLVHSNGVVLGSQDPNQFFTANTFKRLLTADELAKYSCLLTNSSSSFASAGDGLIDLLPSSPDAIRFPTILTNMMGQGTLAANLAVELFSGAWQYFGVIALIKFYKLIPGKFT